GDTSTLGVRQGDVYPLGAGFALAFAGGPLFFPPAPGAPSLSGPLLAPSASLGGAAARALGFPPLPAVPGLAGPARRVRPFSAAAPPVLFWPPAPGAFVVR
ncbi:hypothetical protein C3R44_23340, partial [Mycobacterium tuberculosis]